MTDSSEVQVLHPPRWRQRIGEAQGRRHEAGSEGSVEQSRDPTDRNRIRSLPGRTSGQMIAKSTAIKGRGGKQGGRADRESAASGPPAFDRLPTARWPHTALTPEDTVVVVGGPGARSPRTSPDFVLHAPRQTGKTSTLLALRRGAWRSSTAPKAGRGRRKSIAATRPRGAYPSRCGGCDRGHGGRAGAPRPIHGPERRRPPCVRPRTQWWWRTRPEAGSRRTRPEEVRHVKAASPPP